jgi:hypothetical protein
MSSLFGEVFAGLTKAQAFLVNLFKKEEQVAAEFAKLQPATKAAILATFYDAVKTFNSGVAVAAAGASGNIPLAVTLSANTAGLIQGLVTDVATDGSLIKADFETLAIVLKAPAA